MNLSNCDSFSKSTLDISVTESRQSFSLRLPQSFGRGITIREIGSIFVDVFISLVHCYHDILVELCYPPE